MLFWSKPSQVRFRRYFEHVLYIQYDEQLFSPVSGHLRVSESCYPEHDVRAGREGDRREYRGVVQVSLARLSWDSSCVCWGWRSVALSGVPQAGGGTEAASGREVHPYGEVCREEIPEILVSRACQTGDSCAGASLTHTHATKNM